MGVTAIQGTPALPTLGDRLKGGAQHGAILGGATLGLSGLAIMTMIEMLSSTGMNAGSIAKGGLVGALAGVVAGGAVGAIGGAITHALDGVRGLD